MSLLENDLNSCLGYFFLKRIFYRVFYVLIFPCKNIYIYVFYRRRKVDKKIFINIIGYKRIKVQR